MKIIGSTLLGIWLILTALITLLHLNFSYRSEVMAVLALAAGVFVLIRR
ncbi:MAG: hypothetical protein P8Y64_10220 [Gammaproteobacteria bacterium]|jgi:hypothetical protein